MYCKFRDKTRQTGNNTNNKPRPIKPNAQPRTMKSPPTIKVVTHLIIRVGTVKFIIKFHSALVTLPKGGRISTAGRRTTKEPKPSIN